ncbi:helix-turn-helix domain-containing protein [Kribbella sp. NPDC023972]|uniref:ATP-binding protein n=1 Tax=Kribbella sp. NPDC023972 TaxID=3154795 RepID=UPI003400316F
MPGDEAKDAAHFGMLLRSLRERAGLTQQELAERAEVTSHAISSLERGARTRPYPHTVRSLCDALGATESERAALIAAVPRRKPSAEPVTRATGLVIPPTPLFGRDDDIASVTDLIRSGARLVTLTGPGGVGKTRLTAAVSDVLAGDFPDGVVQISLAPLANASALMATVGRGLGLAGIDDPGAFDLVAAHLRDSRLLLVLDNFEHLLSAAAQVGQLTALCPGLTVLVSSRSPLRVRGEREYVVEPLDLPARDSATVDEVRAHPAGALALDRALAVGARPSVDDVPAYAELCHRLAGLPLAIELAIAQLRLLSPRALLGRLESAGRTSGARDLPERQRTMRATLDWSYSLLDPDQQRLFTLLGAFRGGATLEAVESVAENGDEIPTRDVLGILHELAEHSLVRVRGDRLDLLEPVAQYARSLLVGDRTARIGRAHARFYAGLAERAAAGYERADQVEWLERIEEEEANLLVAVERSLDAGDAPTAARITWFLWLYWWMRGQFTIGRRLAEQCLRAELPPWERSRVNLAAATMSYAAGDQAAAASYWAEADLTAMDLDDPEVRSKAIAGTGLAALAAGDLDTAESRFRVALDFALRDRGSSWMASLVHVWLGTVHLLRGEPAAAVPEIERGLHLARGRGDRLATYVAFYNLSQAALALADYQLARQRVQEGIVLSQETRDLANLAYFVETLAVIESQEGNHLRVATLLGAATGLRETVGADVYAYYLPDDRLRDAAQEAAQTALGEDAYDEAVAAGRSLDPTAVPELASLDQVSPRGSRGDVR